MYKCLLACIYVHHLHAVLIKARRGPHIPSLELQMVVSHDVDAGTPTKVLCKSNKCSLPLSRLSSPKRLFQRFVYVYESLPTLMSLYYMCVVPTEARRE